MTTEPIQPTEDTIKVISNRSEARAAFGPLLKASGLSPQEVGLEDLFTDADEIGP